MMNYQQDLKPSFRLLTSTNYHTWKMNMKTQLMVSQRLDYALGEATERAVELRRRQLKLMSIFGPKSTDVDAD